MTGNESLLGGEVDCADYSKNMSLFLLKCRPFNISERVPIQYAKPLYGYILPIIVAITMITNSFIVIVLSQKHLRTPTNYVLLAMAVAELGTGLISTPWFIYYYTYMGYMTDRYQGLPSFWCQTHAYMAHILPTMFHTSAVWLAVYLAVQRYVYVCVPSLVPTWCTRGKTRTISLIICFCACVAELPRVLAGYFTSYTVYYTDGGQFLKRRYCVYHRAQWISSQGLVSPKMFFGTFFIFQALMVHILPCILLAVFTAVLIRAIRVADARRKRSLFRRQTCGGSGGGGGQGVFGGSSPTATTCMKYFHATTQMLVVVIIIFLMIEIPAAIIFMLHFFIQMGMIGGSEHEKYSWINQALILRNVLILFSYPFNFAIYCGMSQQFRLTVRQLFARQTLFVQQPVANFGRGGKRYSVVLVDINEFKKQKLSRLARGSRRIRKRLKLTDMNSRNSTGDPSLSPCSTATTTNNYNNNNNGGYMGSCSITNNNNNNNNNDNSGILSTTVDNRDSSVAIHDINNRNKPSGVYVKNNTANHARLHANSMYNKRNKLLLMCRPSLSSKSSQKQTNHSSPHRNDAITSNSKNDNSIITLSTAGSAHSTRDDTSIISHLTPIKAATTTLSPLNDNICGRGRSSSSSSSSSGLNDRQETDRHVHHSQQETKGDNLMTSSSIKNNNVDNECPTMRTIRHGWSAKTASISSNNNNINRRRLGRQHHEEDDSKQENENNVLLLTPNSPPSTDRTPNSTLPTTGTTTKIQPSPPNSICLPPPPFVDSSTTTTKSAVILMKETTAMPKNKNKLCSPPRKCSDTTLNGTTLILSRSIGNGFSVTEL